MIEPGEMFRCDRNQKCHEDGMPHSEFMNDSDKRREKWLEVAWTDTDGVEVRYLLCPECREKWLRVERGMRQQSQDFMYDHLYGD